MYMIRSRLFLDGIISLMLARKEVFNFYVISGVFVLQNLHFSFFFIAQKRFVALVHGSTLLNHFHMV